MPGQRGTAVSIPSLIPIPQPSSPAQRPQLCRNCLSFPPNPSGKELLFHSGLGSCFPGQEFPFPPWMASIIHPCINQGLGFFPKTFTLGSNVTS